MLGLTLIIHIFLGSTLAGSLIIGALVLGYTTGVPLISAGIAGFLIAVPASWYVARQISGKVG